MSDTTFYFAEVEVKGTLTNVADFDPPFDRDELEKQVLINYIDSDGPVTESSDEEWYFGAYRDEVEYVVGKFGKVYSDEPVTYDEDSGDFVDEGKPNREADYSMFIIHFEKNLIIYHSRNRVGHEMFRRNFATGFSEQMGKDYELEIQFIKNPTNIEYVIEELPIYHASFELEPSNPHSNPDWEALDDHLKEMLAEKLDVDVEAIENGALNFDDELLAQLSSMAQSEYGEFELTYSEDGYIKQITSDEDEPVQRDEERPESLVELKDKATEFIDFATSFLE